MKSTSHEEFSKARQDIEPNYDKDTQNGILVNLEIVQ